MVAVIGMTMIPRGSVLTGGAAAGAEASPPAPELLRRRAENPAGNQTIRAPARGPSDPSRAGPGCRAARGTRSSASRSFRCKRGAPPSLRCARRPLRPVPGRPAPWPLRLAPSPLRPAPAPAPSIPWANCPATPSPRDPRDVPGSTCAADPKTDRARTSRRSSSCTRAGSAPTPSSNRRARDRRRDSQPNRRAIGEPLCT